MPLNYSLHRGCQETNEAQELHESHESQKKHKKRSASEKSKSQETHEAQDSAPVARVSTVQEAIAVSLERRLNRQTLFLFSRALKAMEFQTGGRIQDKELDGIFYQWWRAAESKVPPQSDSRVYLAKFKAVFRRTKSPLRVNPIEDAWEYAQAHEPLPEFGPVVGRVALVCQRLQQLNGEKPFYISSRWVGRIIGSKDGYECIGALEDLIDCGFMVLAERSVGNLANSYRLDPAYCTHSTASGEYSSSPKSSSGS